MKKRRPDIFKQWSKELLLSIRELERTKVKTEMDWKILNYGRKKDTI